jgi:hypothetical protein
MALIVSDEVTGWRSCQSAKRGIKISIRQGTYGWIPDSQHPAIRSWVTKDGCHKWEVASSKPSGRITAYARNGARWFRPDGRPLGSWPTPSHITPAFSPCVDERPGCDSIQSDENL